MLSKGLGSNVKGPGECCERAWEVLLEGLGSVAVKGQGECCQIAWEALSKCLDGVVKWLGWYC